VTPIGRTFAQKVSFKEKQFAIRLAEYENAKRQYVAELAKQHMSSEELAQKEEGFRDIWIAKGRQLPIRLAHDSTVLLSAVSAE
jgi:hypothetical protein